jgi:hypothetical protein
VQRQNLFFAETKLAAEQRNRRIVQRTQISQQTLVVTHATLTVRQIGQNRQIFSFGIWSPQRRTNEVKLNVLHPGYSRSFEAKARTRSLLFRWKTICLGVTLDPFLLNTWT